MSFRMIIGRESGADPSQFHKAVGIWRQNAHVANRRLLASAEILSIEISNHMLDIFERIESFDISRCVIEHGTDCVDEKALLAMLDIPGKQEATALHDCKIRLYVTKQLPRVPRIFSAGLEFSLFEEQENRVTNIHKSFSMEKRPLGPREPYVIQRGEDGYTSISVYRRLENVVADPSIEWLEKKLFPCVLKWMESEPRVTSSTPLTSLSLVSTEKYARKYCELKEKYGMELIRNWPENTDPMKFVYEDIAIATYLLLLWEKERLEKKTEELQSFRDLGCGNGLLVHILVNEGHPGVGIDLRKRKIWDSYPAGTPLQVHTVVPSSASLYPGVDWLIGNHSDELTPWIPVIAARSSNECRFFLLPCCPYELDGTKYQRYCASKSQYSEYIDYVKSLCEECGFKTHIDKLRIPSTKRICLIGWERTREQENTREDRIQRMISKRATLTHRKHESQDTGEWHCDFKPRNTVERVRNCTQLEKSLIADIVDTVANQLLYDGRTISLEQQSGKLWNAGRRLELRQVAESIPKETMIRLRKECGGLQTLLKNHSNIFRVAEGNVEFRIPGRERVEEKLRKKRSPPQTKVKPCWFRENHPDGCPAIETNCNYKH